MARVEELLQRGGAAQQQAVGGAKATPAAPPPEEMQRLTAAALALLQRLPGVLPLGTAAEALAFLATVVTWMNESRCGGGEAGGGAQRGPSQLPLPGCCMFTTVPAPAAHALSGISSRPCSEFSKVALQVLQALQQLLLTHGHALRGHALGEVARAVQPYLRRAWREARLVRFKVWVGREGARGCAEGQGFGPHLYRTRLPAEAAIVSVCSR
jgi:hypothetical protein